MDYEANLIESFLLPGRQRRWLELRARPKGRAKLAGRLYHFRDLDPRWVVKVNPSQDHADGLADELERRGAGETCWVWSTDPAIQGAQRLRDALAELPGREAALLLCVPGRLGCYLGEEMHSNLILDRRIAPR